MCQKNVYVSLIFCSSFYTYLSPLNTISGRGSAFLFPIFVLPDANAQNSNGYILTTVSFQHSTSTTVCISCCKAGLIKQAVLPYSACACHTPWSNKTVSRQKSPSGQHSKIADVIGQECTQYPRLLTVRWDELSKTCRQGRLSLWA